MALNKTQQLIEQIEQKQNILIVFRPLAKSDGLASALALSLFLKKLNKQVDIATSHLPSAGRLPPLEGLESIKTGLAGLKKLVIAIKTKKVKPAEISYTQKEDEVEIYVTPKNGIFNESDINITSSEFCYQLIIVIDSPDLESLGSIYKQGPDFFQSVPLINIDSSPANEHFGHINLVDITASSCAEIVFNLLNGWRPELIDQSIATALLTALISATNGFRYGNLKPSTLNIASQLIALGADREEIMRRLYGNRSPEILKLWGRVLVRLEADLLNNLIWAVLPKTDFEKTGTKPADLTGVNQELIAMMSTAKIIVLIYELAEKKVGVNIETTRPGIDLRLVAKQWLPTGTKEQVTFEISGKPLLAAAREVINEIKHKLTHLSPSQLSSL